MNSTNCCQDLSVILGVSLATIIRFQFVFLGGSVATLSDLAEDGGYCIAAKLRGVQSRRRQSAKRFGNLVRRQAASLLGSLTDEQVREY